MLDGIIVGTMRVKAKVLGVRSDRVSQGKTCNGRPCPLGVLFAGRFVQRAIELCASSDAKPVANFPGIDPIQSTKDFVAGEITTSAWDGHLRNECHFRQIAVLWREANLEAEVQVFAARSARDRRIERVGGVGEPEF